MNKLSILKTKKEKIARLDYLICRRFKQCRTIFGISQQKVADAIGVSTQQVQKYENSVNRISSGKLLAISQSLAMSLDYFFNFDHNIEKYIPQVGEEGDEYYFDGEFSIEEINKGEIASFVRAICGIKDYHVRRKLLELIKSM